MPASGETLQQAVMNALESEERRRLRLSGQAKSFGAQAMVISVFGAKGGVGKSTVAVNLSVALSQHMGQSVVLVDVDSTFGDVAAMLEMQTDCNIVDFASRTHEFTRSSVTEHLVQHVSGLWVLPAPRDTLAWRQLSPDRLHEVIALLSQRFDVVVLDTTAVITEVMLTALQDSGVVVWVTSSDFSSVNNSLLGLETLQKLSYPESRIRVVLNVTSAEDGVRPEKISTALGRELFWVLPYDREMHRGGEIGQPIVSTNPGSRGARSVLKLAQAITGITAKDTRSRTSTRIGRIRTILRKRRPAPEAPRAEARAEAD
jgi:pilus assembly protein CpaE